MHIHFHINQPVHVHVAHMSLQNPADNNTKESLYSITHKLKQMSEVLDQLNAKVDRITAATTGVAGDIRSIKDQLSGGVSAEEAAALSEKLEAAASRLEGLDAETPADETPATPETPVEETPAG